MASWKNLTPRDKGKVFLFGGFGGMAPTLIGMAHQLWSRSPDNGVYMLTDPFAWSGCVVMALVAGVVVLAYKETSTMKAIGLGASAPSLLLGFAAGPGQPAPGGSGETSWLEVLSLRPLFAQGPRTGIQAQGTPSAVWLSFPGLTGALPPGLAPTVQIEWLITSDGGEEERVTETYSVRGSDYFMIEIPQGANDINLSVAGVRSNQLSLDALDLSAGDSLRFSVGEGRPSPWSRVLRPFGFRSKPSVEIAAIPPGGP